MRRRTLLGGLAAAALIGPRAHAASPLVLGTSTAMSGPSAHLGRSVARGMRWALEGQTVAGRPVELRVLDDGYRKDLAGQNMATLCEDPSVLAVIGNVGTPTALETHGLAAEHAVPLFGAVTGTDAIRKPGLDYVWNVRASYRQELAVSIGALQNHGVPAHEFAFFGQDDGYGDAVYTATTELLGQSVPRATYPRNTSEVEDAARFFWDRAIPPRVIVLGGTALPTAKFVGMLRPHLPKTLFVNVSFTAARGLLVALGPDEAEGLIITQVVPPVSALDVPAVRAFRDDCDRKNPSQLALEGHIVASMFLEVLRRAAAAGALSRAGLQDTLASFGAFRTDVGRPLVLDQDKHQAGEHVWPTVLRGGQVVPLDFASLDL